MEALPLWQPNGTIGRYVLLSLVARGGMGEVWKARDPRLGRVVAIKRTKVGLSTSVEKEARAIAALNHPHICQLYDIGPDYLVLEYLTGKPLAGPVPPDVAVRLAEQMADALEEAHRHGIIHRDLKPSNIHVTDQGTIKLLDFGIAQLNPSSHPDITVTIDTDIILGTPAYMSPEQIEAKPLDERSDVFSFGAVLYELLSGRKAFAGETVPAIVTAVMRDDPPPIDVPASLDRVIRRCLEKDPAARFQHIGEVRSALRGAPLDDFETEPSMAVLPLANMSADPGDVYFSDGLTEELLNLLTRVPGLRVTARASSFAFRGKDVDVQQIARHLGVKYVLEGSVRRAGNRIRVMVQLVNPADGYPILSERYDRELADVFAVQDEIAAAIAQALQVRLAPRRAAPRASTSDLAAHEAFLKGRHHLLRITPESLERSKEYFLQALSLDPHFALAHSHLAWYHFLQAFHGLRPSHEAIPLARRAAESALEHDPSLPQARSMLASIAALYDYNWAVANQLFRLALDSKPVHGDVRWAFGNSYLLPFGRAAEAADELHLALEQDPLNVVYRNARGIFLYVAGKHEQGAREAQAAIEIDDRYWGAHFSLGMNYASRSLWADAAAAAERAYTLAPWTPCTSALWAAVLRQMGDAAFADDLFDRMSRMPGQRHWGMVLYHLVCGDNEDAVRWLERAIEQRDLMTIIQIRSPLAAQMRAHARWPDLARQINLPIPGSER
jgi:eukaryotic-like serine/threonine-protein kinase